MIKIFHNPRCSKSREGLALLTDKKIDFELIKYLDTPIKKNELIEVINLLKITPLQLIRKTEKIWKENFKGKTLSDDDLIKAMLQNPKLIERPIIINGNKAVIGRPTEKINTII